MNPITKNPRIAELKSYFQQNPEVARRFERELEAALSDAFKDEDSFCGTFLQVADADKRQMNKRAELEAGRIKNSGRSQEEKNLAALALFFRTISNGLQQAVQTGSELFSKELVARLLGTLPDDQRDRLKEGVEEVVRGITDGIKKMMTPKKPTKPPGGQYYH